MTRPPMAHKPPHAHPVAPSGFTPRDRLIALVAGTAAVAGFLVAAPWVLAWLS